MDATTCERCRRSSAVIFTLSITYVCSSTSRRSSVPTTQRPRRGIAIGSLRDWEVWRLTWLARVSPVVSAMATPSPWPTFVSCRRFSTPALRLSARRLWHSDCDLRTMHGRRRLSHDPAQHSGRRILNRTAPWDGQGSPVCARSISTGLKDRPAKMIVAVDEADQGYDERVALLREERLEQTLLGTSHRPIHLSR